MILESIVTTVDAEGTVNTAPMGPVVDRELTQFTLRPFRPSRTYDNLSLHRRAVIHVTDDALLIARLVTGQSVVPRMHTILDGRWWVLSDACRYFAVEIDRWTDGPVRAEGECRVVASGELRPFFGFNRAKHAVIEAAIVATRLHLIDREEVRSSLERLQSLVDKTAGEEEREAFALLQDFIRNRDQLRITRATEK